MSRRVAFPFLTLDGAALSASPWLVGLGDAPLEPAIDHLKDWDYAAPIAVRRVLEIDRAAAAEALGIPERDLTFAIVLAVGTGSGRLPRDVQLFGPWPVTEAVTELEINEVIPGARLSGALHLETIAVLTASPARRGPLSPWRNGARLWSDAVKIRLDGDEGRLPLEVMSFAKVFPGSPMQSALWHLDWRPGDWGRDFNGAVRLLVNSDHPAFLQRVMDCDPTTLQTLLGDVMAQIVEQALADEETAAALGGMEAETLGGQAASWIDLVWPAQTPEHVRGLMLTHPGRLRSALQAAAMLEGDS